jgi:hypothetical protein
MKRFLRFIFPVIFFTAVFLFLNRLTYSLDNAGYLGMSLPADFQAFNKKSPWNTAIPNNPEIDPNSELMISNLKNKVKILKANILNWTIPLFVIDSKASPKRDVKTSSDHLNPSVDPEDKGVAKGLPIPEGVWPDPKEDAHMLLVDPRARKTWDFSKAKRMPDGSWTASRIDVWDLDGTGFRAPFSGRYWWTYGARGSGMPLIAGLIRPEEIEAGEIKHALVCATPLNRKTSLPGVKFELCSPASRTDGNNTGIEFIPEGARLQLDPNLDLNSLNLSPASKIVAKAMQKYGMYVGDNADDFTIYFQNLGPDGGKWKKYNLFNDLKNIPVNKFRIIKCKIITKQ